jgi:hypothetical protein
MYLLFVLKTFSVLVLTCQTSMNITCTNKKPSWGCQLFLRVESDPGTKLFETHCFCFHKFVLFPAGFYFYSFALFSFLFFKMSCLYVAHSGFNWQSSCFSLSSSWDYRLVPVYPA